MTRQSGDFMTDVSNRSGGADFHAEEVRVGQDVVGRDKIVQNITQQTAPAERCHNSLPNQPYFFGRKDELQRVADALDPEAQGWGVLISGPGGIGKTALAIRAGHLAPDEHYPIKIFLSAKITQLTPQGPEKLEDFMLPNYIALLSELACELGDDAIAKMDPNLRANEVRRLLADKHALLVIDNLETFDEGERTRVFQFLGRLPRSCKAIVTSRRWKDVRAESIRLDKLERSDALQLISKLAESNKHLAKATEAERIELYEITRGNPLLIEWLAGQLGNAKSQCRTIADACKFMETAPKDNDPLEFVFGDLLDTFTKHETAVLAALTYFTQPAEVKWIAEIAKITTLQAETALEDLADRSVLVLEDHKYLLPPLTATFLRHARPEVIATAGNSLSDRAYALAQENGWSKHDRFPTLEAEWPTLAAAIPLMLSGDNYRLQELCAALAFFLEFSGRWDEWLSLDLQAEEKAMTAKDANQAGERAYDAGWVYYLRGQSAEVLACAERAAQHWAETGARERAMAVRLRGVGHNIAKDYPAAIAAYQEALELDRVRAPESEDVAIGLSDLAGAELASGDYAAAERDYREALRISKKVNYRGGVAIDTGNLADLALNREQWAEAEQWAREALPLAEALGKQESVARQCWRIAKACARQGRKAEGLPYAQRAVAIYTKLRSPDLAWAQAVLTECEDASD
jgi:tetratricopeptide (TPR) repeat protein